MKKIIGIFSMLFLLAITLGSCTDAPVLSALGGEA